MVITKAIALVKRTRLRIKTVVVIGIVVLLLPVVLVTVCHQP